MSKLTTNLEAVIKAICTKSFAKQDVYHTTKATFSSLRDIIHQIVDELHREMANKEKQVEIMVEEKRDYEVQLRFAGDALLFSMHSNVFNFDERHYVYTTDYVKEEPMRAYCGMISIYNFLADSYRFNRMADVGYLIARIFLNKDGHFFVEGHRQLGFLYNEFGEAIINEVYLRAIVEASMQYSLDFDLMVPPFEAIKEITVQEMKIMSQQAGWKTSKIPGFRYGMEGDGPKNQSD